MASRSLAAKIASPGRSTGPALADQLAGRAPGQHRQGVGLDHLELDAGSATHGLPRTAEPVGHLTDRRRSADVGDAPAAHVDEVPDG